MEFCILKVKHFSRHNFNSKSTYFKNIAKHPNSYEVLLPEDGNNMIKESQEFLVLVSRQKVT